MANMRFWLLMLVFTSASSMALATDRFYIGVEAGFSKSGDIDVPQSFVNHPTRCDSLLYTSGATAPTDSECTTDKTSGFLSAFSPGLGFTGGAALGYALGNGLRFEAEYLNRRQSSDGTLIPLGSSSDDPLDQKSSEWDQNDPPSANLSDITAHHFFFNAYYDMRNDSPFTPYIGAGVGLGSAQMRYSSKFLRRSDLGTEPWQMAAAGTISSVDTELDETSFAYQVVGGIDYLLGEDLSIGTKVRWIRLSGFDKDDVSWDKIRDHAPVRADGVTPFTADFEVDDTDSWTFTIGLKYYL